MFPKHMNRAHTESRETEKKKWSEPDDRNVCMWVKTFIFCNSLLLLLLRTGEQKESSTMSSSQKLGFGLLAYSRAEPYIINKAFILRFGLAGLRSRNSIRKLLWAQQRDFFLCDKRKFALIVEECGYLKFALNAHFKCFMHPLS